MRTDDVMLLHPRQECVWAMLCCSEIGMSLDVVRLGGDRKDRGTCYVEQ